MVLIQSTIGERERAQRQQQQQINDNEKLCKLSKKLNADYDGMCMQTEIEWQHNRDCGPNGLWAALPKNLPNR